MSPRTPFARSPVALLANAGTWLNQALESMLEPLGYRVLSVATGRELLDRAPTARPDVILMDANLQDLDSITVCRTLRQHRAVSWHTPIFMITSTPATKQQRLAALEAGAWDYLSLVINSEELALKLDAFVRVKLEGVELQGQLLRVDHQAQVVPCSGLECGEPLLLGRRRRRDHENGSMPGDGPMLAEGAAHRDAVQVLEVRVHEDDIGPRGGRPVQQLASGRDGQNSIPQRLEHALERLVEPCPRVREERDGRAGEGRPKRHDAVNVATALVGRTRQNPRWHRENTRVREQSSLPGWRSGRDRRRR